MDFKRILTIQDISCVGQCSLTVALPIVSACGVETSVLPTAVLSTHTGGFTGFTFRDLTDDIPGIQKHWQKEGITFDAIYTGYLGSTKQVAYVAEVLDTMGSERSVKIVDPAMADGGKLYYGFDDEFVAAMRTLIPRADYLLPNITEACFLAGVPFEERHDRPFCEMLIKKLYDMGAKNVILTGESFTEGMTGFISYDGESFCDYAHERIARGCHGTGDIYASAFTGALMNGKDAYTSAKIAADFVVEAIKCSQADPDHTYGARFEPVLYKLCEMVKGEE